MSSTTSSKGKLQRPKELTDADQVRLLQEKIAGQEMTNKSLREALKLLELQHKKVAREQAEEMANLITRYNLFKLYYHYQALFDSAWLRRWDDLDLRNKSAAVIDHHVRLYLNMKHSQWQYSVKTVEPTSEGKQEGQGGWRGGTLGARLWDGKPPIIQQAFTLRRSTNKDILGVWVRSLEGEFHCQRLIGGTFEEYLQRREYLNLSTLSDSNLRALLPVDDLNRTTYYCLEGHQQDTSTIRRHFFLDEEDLPYSMAYAEQGLIAAEGSHRRGYIAERDRRCQGVHFSRSTKWPLTEGDLRCLWSNPAEPDAEIEAWFSQLSCLRLSEWRPRFE